MYESREILSHGKINALPNGPQESRVTCHACHMAVPLYTYRSCAPRRPEDPSGSKKKACTMPSYKSGAKEGCVFAVDCLSAGLVKCRLDNDLSLLWHVHGLPGTPLAPDEEHSRDSSGTRCARH